MPVVNISVQFWPVSVAVCLFVASRSSTETDERIGEWHQLDLDLAPDR